MKQENVCYFSGSTKLYVVLLKSFMNNSVTLRMPAVPSLPVNALSVLEIDLRTICPFIIALTHWGRVTHICVGKLTIIGSDNGLSPGRRQAIIWTNAGILLIGPLGTKFSEILIKIYTFSFKKINLKVSSGKWRPSCLGLNELMRGLSSLRGQAMKILMPKQMVDILHPWDGISSYWRNFNPRLHRKLQKW